MKTRNVNFHGNNTFLTVCFVWLVFVKWLKIHSFWFFLYMHCKNFIWIFMSPGECLVVTFLIYALAFLLLSHSNKIQCFYPCENAIHLQYFLCINNSFFDIPDALIHIDCNHLQNVICYSVKTGNLCSSIANCLTYNFLEQCFRFFFFHILLGFSFQS